MDLKMEGDEAAAVSHSEFVAILSMVYRKSQS
jgi:hypothetical protein